MIEHNEDLSIPLAASSEHQPITVGAALPSVATGEPSLPTLDEATKAREDEPAALPVPPGASALAHSAIDREPVRPYAERLPNGTVIVRN